SYFDRKGRDLLRIDSCDLLEESFTLHGDLAKAALLSYIAEIVDTFSREREADPRYFRLLTSVMGAVREGVDVAMLARYFEVWTLKLHGLFPSLSRCDSCGRDVSACGGYLTVAEMPRFTCPSCGGREPSKCVAVSARAITLLGQIRTLAPADLTRLRPDRVALEEMEKAAVAMLNAFVGHPFRSYRFLREVRAL
ncbi:MAG: DNA repair protein RecO, partial [Acidobacteriota bacterium]